MILFLKSHNLSPNVRKHQKKTNLSTFYKILEQDSSKLSRSKKKKKVSVWSEEVRARCWMD
jgi:hypothetical protein